MGYWHNIGAKEVSLVLFVIKEDAAVRIGWGIYGLGVKGISGVMHSSFLHPANSAIRHLGKSARDPSPRWRRGCYETRAVR
jgi:hypothetical protein